MTDPLDQPEPDGYALVIPFVACVSQGGPYDDASFTAGLQAGQIHAALRSAIAAAADRVRFTVRTDLLKQLDLIAMHHGFTVTAQGSEEWPEWTNWTAERPRHEPTEEPKP